MSTSSMSRPSSAMHVATNTLISPLLNDCEDDERGGEGKGEEESGCKLDTEVRGTVLTCSEQLLSYRESSSMR